MEYGAFGESPNWRWHGKPINPNLYIGDQFTSAAVIPLKGLHRDFVDGRPRRHGRGKGGGLDQIRGKRARSAREETSHKHIGLWASVGAAGTKTGGVQRFLRYFGKTAASAQARNAGRQRRTRGILSKRGSLC